MYQLVDMFALPEMTLYANVIQVSVHLLSVVYVLVYYVKIVTSLIAYCADMLTLLMFSWDDIVISFLGQKNCCAHCASVAVYRHYGVI